MPLSALRFRPYHHGTSVDSIDSGPRTPKSPRGAYTGKPVPFRQHKVIQPKKILFALLTLLTLSSALLYLLPQLRIAIPGLRLLPYKSSLSWPTYPPALAAQQQQQQQQNQPKQQKPNSFVPDFPLYEMTFKDVHPFQQKGKAADSAWSNMFPHGGGSIAVKNPRNFGLPPSMLALDATGNNISDTEIYEVSVIRQLGCLSLLRRILMDYEDHVEPQVQTQTHAFHCLDHVRQAVLCASDTSLEPINDRESRPYPDVMGSSKGATSGLKSARHMCRKWNEVRDWMEINRPADL